MPLTIIANMCDSVLLWIALLPLVVSVGFIAWTRHSIVSVSDEMEEALCAFSEAAHCLNAVLTDVFGDVIVVTLKNGAALFFMGMFVEKPNASTVQVKTTDVQAFNIGEGDTVTIDSVVYTISHTKNDAAGVTTWTLGIEPSWKNQTEGVAYEK